MKPNKAKASTLLHQSGSPDSRPVRCLPMRVGPPWVEVAIMTIADSVNDRRFTASDIVEQFKLHECVEREPSTVAEFVRAIGPEPDGMGLVCQDEEVIPCRENAVKALEALGFKLHEPPTRETFTEKLLCYTYKLPSLEALYARIAAVPTLASVNKVRSF